MRLLIAFLAVAILSGCASMTIAEKSVTQKVQEPWQKQVLRAEVFKGGIVGVRSVELPLPLPSMWTDELIDFSRSFSGTGREEDTEPVITSVLRAIFYRGEHSIGDDVDAVLDMERTAFQVLVPAGRIDELNDTNLLIVSGRGTFALTTRGETVDLRQVKDLRQLPTGFFREHSSPMETIVPVEFGNPYGRKFLTELLNEYPFILRVRPSNTMYFTSSPHVKVVGAKFTAVDSVFDRLGSCTNFRLDPSIVSLQGQILTGVSYLDQAVTALSAEDCMKAVPLLQQLQRSVREFWQKSIVAKE